MLVVLLALTLSHAASKRELLECTSYKPEAEVSACVAVWEERRKAQYCLDIKPCTNTTVPSTSI